MVPLYSDKFSLIVLNLSNILDLNFFSLINIFIFFIEFKLILKFNLNLNLRRLNKLDKINFTGLEYLI